MRGDSVASRRESDEGSGYAHAFAKGEADPVGARGDSERVLCGVDGRALERDGAVAWDFDQVIQADIEGIQRSFPGSAVPGGVAIVLGGDLDAGGVVQGGQEGILQVCE